MWTYGPGDPNSIDVFNINDLANSGKPFLVCEMMPGTSDYFVSGISSAWWGKGNIDKHDVDDGFDINKCWRPSKIRISWTPAEKGIQIYAWDSAFVDIVDYDTIHYGGYAEMNITWQDHSDLGLFYSVLEYLGVESSDNSVISIIQLDAYGDNPANYWQIGDIPLNTTLPTTTTTTQYIPGWTHVTQSGQNVLADVVGISNDGSVVVKTTWSDYSLSISTDYGATFNNITTTPYIYDPAQIYKIKVSGNGDKIAICRWSNAEGMTILTSQDLGQTWQHTIGTGSFNHLYGTKSTYSSGGYLISSNESGAPKISGDWGTTWTSLSGIPSNADTMYRYPIISEDGLKIMFVLFPNTTYSSINGGSTWTTVVGGMTPQIATKDCGIIIATDPSENVVKSTDFGSTWTTIYTASYMMLYDIVMTEDGNKILMTLSVQGEPAFRLVYSDNGGTSWVSKKQFEYGIPMTESVIRLGATPDFSAVYASCASVSVPNNVLIKYTNL